MRFVGNMLTYISVSVQISQTQQHGTLVDTPVLDRLSTAACLNLSTRMNYLCSDCVPYDRFAILSPSSAVFVYLF
jgi:hypothetical protein